MYPVSLQLAALIAILVLLFIYFALIFITNTVRWSWSVGYFKEEIGKKLFLNQQDKHILQQKCKQATFGGALIEFRTKRLSLPNC